jgi:Clostripain family
VLARLTTPELSEQSATLEQFDIIAFDACDCSTLEMAHQLQPFARYLLASQIRMPLPGFPYHRVLAHLAARQGRLMGPAEFGRWAVRRFCEFYSVREEDRDTVSLTLLDLQQVEPIVQATDRLARVLLARIVDATEDEAFVKGLFRLARTIDTADPGKQIKPFVDVADLCLNLLLHCNSEEVRETARALGNLLLSPGPVPGGASEKGTGVPFIAEHGRNACTTGRLNGVNLYAPHVAGTNDEFREMNDRYGSFRFARDFAWSALVMAMAAR